MRQCDLLSVPPAGPDKCAMMFQHNAVQANRPRSESNKCRNTRFACVWEQPLFQRSVMTRNVYLLGRPAPTTCAAVERNEYLQQHMDFRGNAFIPRLLGEIRFPHKTRLLTISPHFSTGRHPQCAGRSTKICTPDQKLQMWGKRMSLALDLRCFVCGHRPHKMGRSSPVACTCSTARHHPTAARRAVNKHTCRVNLWQDTIGRKAKLWLCGVYADASFRNNRCHTNAQRDWHDQRLDDLS